MPGEWTPVSFDDYELVRPLGRGAMGEVYLARDRVLERTVAIKFVSAAQISPVARARFLREARAVAKLQHPNVVSVFRVGEQAGRPFLVSEYVAGEPLDRARRPMAWQRVQDIFLGLARGLAAAHRAGVVHRDVKPANAIVTEDGGVKLLDFGIARVLDEPTLALPPLAPQPPPTYEASETLDSEGRPLPFTNAAQVVRTAAGQLMGTPLYLAPELWRGEEASFRSDVYSLGVLAWELCVGTAPLAGVPVAELAQRSTEPLPSLLGLVPGIERGFAALLERCLSREPQRRFESAEALRVELERARVVTPRAAAGVTQTPFRGWEPYERVHAPFFFGRTDEIAAVTERLAAQRCVIVTGDAGVGKTSLCRAGVLPFLEQGHSGSRWRVGVLEPGTRAPALRLVDALTPLLGASVAAKVIAAPSEVARALRSKLGPDELVLFVDVLEACLDDDAFADSLRALLDSGAARLLATAGNASLQRLGEDFTRGLFWLRPPASPAARELVVGPAAAAGFTFDSEWLIDQLVARATMPDGLAIASFMLAELWRLRDDVRRTVTRAAWDQLGGVSGALVRYAEQTIHALDEATAHEAGVVLSSLVSPDGRAVERVADDERTASRARDALVAARLVVVRADGGRERLQLADECLIREWPWLQQLADADREVKRAQARVERGWAEWQRLGEVDEALFSLAHLEEIDQLLAGTSTLAPRLTTAQLAWLARSRRFHQRRRAQRWALGLGVPVLVLTAVALPVKRAYDDARRESTQRTWSVRAREDAQSRVDAARRARALALEAFDRGDLDQGETLWEAALSATANASAALERGRQTVDEELQLGTRHLDAARADLAALEQLTQRFGFETWKVSDPGPGTATLELTAEPAAQVRLWRRSEAGWRDDGSIGTTPVKTSLASGSVVLELTHGEVSAKLPLLLEPGATEHHEVRLPAAVPTGFVFVPAGPLLLGHGGDDGLRRFFLNAEPLHRVTTGPYLIAQHETTFGQWLTFLAALPPRERAARAPRVDQMLHGVELKPDGLTLTTSGIVHVLRAGEPLTLPARATRQTQPWEALPVTGVSFEDVLAYLGWLRATGVLPGARPCTDAEWERAARGADGRTWPQGNVLHPDDANYDLTYGRQAAAFGPDVVGSHPASRSPVGVDDLAGNVWEWTVSRHDPTEVINRGGSWYQGPTSAMAANRERSERTHRDPLLGFRVCADPW